MYQKTVLDNGLRLITSTVAHSPSVCIGIFIGTGPRYESPAEAGISHFIEHLCFKGTERRRTAKDICEAIEGVGGIINGGTDKELTLYWCKVARPHFDLALDVLTDVLRHSQFNLEDIERERHIISEEIDMVRDSPQQRVDMLIEEVLWPDQPMGRDVAGTKKTVEAINRQMMLDYLARYYLPNNSIVSIVGSMEHEEVVTCLNEILGDWDPGQLNSGYTTIDEQKVPQLKVEHRDTEQAHICLALRGLSYQHPDRFILDLLNVILGQGMSSRLFTEIRDRRGLAYDIHSYVSHFLDSGAFTIYAGVDPNQVEVTLAAILEQLSLLREVISEAEITRAKEYSNGHLLLRMEDTRAIVGWLGGQELLTRDVLTVEEVTSRINAITADDLQRVARQVFINEKLNLAVVGPNQSKDRLGQILIL